jgi:hypothetical protein
VNATLVRVGSEPYRTRKARQEVEDSEFESATEYLKTKLPSASFSDFNMIIVFRMLIYV